MKRRSKKSAAMKDGPQNKYEFDYRKAKPNRFASRLKSGSRMIVLDEDVARIFTTGESVNAVLRALMQTMPNASSPP